MAARPALESRTLGAQLYAMYCCVVDCDGEADCTVATAMCAAASKRSLRLPGTRGADCPAGASAVALSC
jgi:hypothetical protein